MGAECEKCGYDIYDECYHCNTVEQLEQKLKIAVKALELVTEHAETCSIFIYNSENCTCYYEKIWKVLEKLNA